MIGIRLPRNDSTIRADAPRTINTVRATRRLDRASGHVREGDEGKGSD
jgi:hypothetical protein